MHPTPGGGQSGLGFDPFTPGGDERFRANALIAFVALVCLSLSGALAFLLLF